MKILKSALLILFVLTASTVASDQIPAPPQNKPIALTGGSIHPVTSPVIENGTILFENGKITAIGRNVKIPAGVEVMDVSGMHIYPGLVDAFSRIGLTEIGAVRATNDISETGLINPNVRAEVAVNPNSEIIPVTRANGVTAALVSPGGGTISGLSALMMLEGWTWEEMTLKTPVSLQVNWPRMTTVTAWWMQKTEEEQKKDREGALAALEQAFKEGRAYMTAKQAEDKKGVPFHNSDLRWEAVIPVFEKKIPVMVSAEEIQQIQMAVAWAERENIDLIIYGGTDAWRAVELLKSKNIPVIIEGTHRLPERRWEAYDEPFVLPKKLYEAGVKFCIAGGGASNERNLPYLAATAAAYGLPKDEALKSVTLYPAQILGVADRLGSLEKGKDATLIVTTGDPLETATQVVQEYIQGRKVDLTSRHTMLYEKYKIKYSQPELK
jgi:imidazolonepropionase-like amidohydrolase